MDVDMLDCYLLLAFTAVAIERFEERHIGAGELVRLRRIFPATFEGLLVNHGTPGALHRRIVGGGQLGRHHALQLVLRPDANQRGGALICLSRVGGNASKAPPRSGGSAGFGVGRNERQGLITDREIELGRVICHICGAP
jgi:hypothetical protein